MRDDIEERKKKKKTTELYYIPLLMRLHASQSLQNHMPLHPAKEMTSFWGSFREGEDGEMKGLESRMIYTWSLLRRGHGRIISGPVFHVEDKLRLGQAPTHTNTNIVLRCQQHTKKLF